MKFKKTTFQTSLILLLSLGAFSCAGSKTAKMYTIKFMNFDEVIQSTQYEEGHTIVPPDAIRDFDDVANCKRYFFLNYYDTDNKAFEIGTKATKDMVYTAKYDIKDKHKFKAEDVNYTWGEQGTASEGKCQGSTRCETCNKDVEETVTATKIEDKNTPCYNAYHYEAEFNTIGFEAQDSEQYRTVLGEHAFTKNWAKDYIGNSGTYYCDKCGDPNPSGGTAKGSASTTDEVHFDYDQFGTELWLVGNWGSYTGGDEQIDDIYTDLNKPHEMIYDCDDALNYVSGYAEFLIKLPKVKYNDYSKVSFVISFGDATYGVLLDGKDWKEPGTEGAIQGAYFDATLDIEYKTGNYVVTLSKKESEEKTIVITKTEPVSSEVLNGTESLTIRFNSMIFSETTIKSIELTAK